VPYLNAIDSAGNLQIYIIETPKDSLRLSLGLAVSCALSHLWYYCGRFCGRYEWKVFLDVERIGPFGAGHLKKAVEKMTHKKSPRTDPGA
jgi:hypothetical protein